MIIAVTALIAVVAVSLALLLRSREHARAAERERDQARRERDAAERERQRDREQHERELIAAERRHEELRASEKNAAAEQLRALEAATAEKIALVAGNREQLADQMKAIAGDATKQAVAALGETNAKARELERLESTSERKAAAEQITAAVAPIAKSLEKVETQVQGLERERSQTQGQVSQMFESVASEVGRLRLETGQLVSALKRPQVRGQWGEMSLRNVAKAANMTENVDFHIQSTIEAGDGRRQRPDMVVHLPTERDVAVDAKVPLDAFLAAHECDDESERDAHLDRHARQLRTHIDGLSSKSYFAALDTPAEFAVCFLPNEAIYCTALDRDPSLLDHGAANSVLIATPTTLLALLYACAYGWKQASIEESAREIAASARELHRRAGKLLDDIAKIGRGLGTTMNAYNAAVGSIEGRLMPQLRRIEELGAGSDKSVKAPAQIEQSPRLVTAPELRAAGRARSDEAEKTDPPGAKAA